MYREVGSGSWSESSDSWECMEEVKRSSWSGNVRQLTRVGHIEKVWSGNAD